MASEESINSTTIILSSLFDDLYTKLESIIKNNSFGRKYEIFVLYQLRNQTNFFVKNNNDEILAGNEQITNIKDYVFQYEFLKNDVNKLYEELQVETVKYELYKQGHDVFNEIDMLKEEIKDIKNLVKRNDELICKIEDEYFAQPSLADISGIDLIFKNDELRKNQIKKELSTYEKSFAKTFRCIFLEKLKEMQFE